MCIVSVHFSSDNEPKSVYSAISFLLVNTTTQILFTGSPSFKNEKNCPVCNGEKRGAGRGGRDCRVRNDGAMILCRTGLDRGITSAPGWKYVKESSLEGFGIYVEDVAASSYDFDPARYYAIKKEREKADIALREGLLGETERAELYAILHTELSINSRHSNKLLARGLSIEEIELCGLKSWESKKRVDLSDRLPGIGQGGKSTLLGTGIWLPAYDPQGRIMGGQMMPDAGDAKYIWVSSAHRGGNSPQMPNGELPLFVQRQGEPRSGNTDDVWLCEGALKSAIASVKSGNIFIGASGGQFVGSKDTLLSYLQQLGARRIILAPDAGTVENLSVSKNNIKTLKLLQIWAKTHKFEVLVAWWGQGVKTSGNDIDDLLVKGESSRIALITPEEFYELNSPALRQKLDQHAAITPGLKEQDFPAPIEIQETKGHRRYKSGGRDKEWEYLASTEKFILDTSTMGTGKSHTAGSLRPETLQLGAIAYLSGDPRNATTSTLRDWLVLQGRHDGLVEKKLKNSEGTETTLLRRKGNDFNGALHTPPNCDRTDLAQILASKNLSPDSDAVCDGCQHKRSCAIGKGEFNFLHQRIEVLKQNRFIAHAASVTGDCFPANTLVFADEASKLEWTKTYTAGDADIAYVAAQILRNHTWLDDDSPPGFMELWECVGKLWDLLTPDSILWEMPYGMSHTEILELCLDGKPLPEVAEQYLEEFGGDKASFMKEADEFKGFAKDDDKALKKVREFKSHKKHLEQKARKLRLRWLPDFYRALRGDAGYQLHFHTDGLNITTPNKTLIETLKHPNVKAVIFSDATMNPEFLSQILGEKVVHTAQEDPVDTAKVKIVQIFGNGKPGGRNRRVRQNSRQRRLIEAIKSKTNNLAVISFGNYAEKGESIWFSDSRGGNHLETASGLILDGVPMPSLSAKATEYATIYGENVDVRDTTLNSYPIRAKNTPPGGPYWNNTLRECSHKGFAKFYRESILAEIEQGIGRLRATRRPGEELTVYVLSEYPLDCEVDEFIHISEFINLEPTMDERVEEAMEKMKSEGVKITGQAIADLVGCVKSTVCRTPSFQAHLKAQKQLQCVDYSESRDASNIECGLAQKQSA